jgi:hypothetical protein
MILNRTFEQSRFDTWKAELDRGASQLAGAA